jgi:hypothetical protein
MFKGFRTCSILGSRLAALAAMGLLVTTLASPVTVAAQTPALVRPDPLTLGLRAGDQGAVTIRVEGAEGLYGAEVHLTFDPAVLEVVDADATASGVQVKPGEWLKDGFVAVNKADNALGKIDFAVTLLNPAAPVSGSGNLFTVTLRAKANGGSALKIASALLASKEAREIKSAWQDGAVAVSAGGQAPQAPTAPAVAAAPAQASAPATAGTGSPAAETAKPSQVIMPAVAGAAVLFLMAAGVLLAVVVKRRA